MKISKYIILTLSTVSVISLRAQEVDLANVKDNFSKKNIVKVNGGINAGLITYGGKSAADRNPLTYNIAGNLNFRLFKVLDIPVSLNISNANRNLKLPVTPSRISISPRYKAFTAYIGDVNLVYSPYTLNGHQFTGAGLDISPAEKPLKFRGMFGRLQKGINYDSTNSKQISAYERWGFGSSVQFVKNTYDLGLNFFTAKDQINSLMVKPDAIGITPEQNIVGSFNFAIRPFKGLEFKTEYAISALTTELRDSTNEVKRSSGIYNGIYPVNNSTYYSKARKLGLNYQIKKTILGLGYEKIDPGYRTLGAYFFANDLENFTVNVGKMLFKNKLNFNLVTGLQRDNLNDAKSGTNQRIVGNLALNYTPNQKLNLSGNYSNFRTYMRIKSQYQFINQLNQYQSLDTFNFTQITQNVNVAVSYMFKDSKTSSQSFLTNVSAQNAIASQSGNEIKDASNVFYNLSLSHLYVQKIFKLTVVSSYLATFNSIATDNFLTQGPAFSINNSLMKDRLKLGLMYNFNNTTSSNKSISSVSVHNIRISIHTILKKKHNLIFSLMHQIKGSTSNQIGNVMYNFNF